MKFQVKTTALAILVSLGVVACAPSNDSNHNQPTQPTPVKTESSTTDVDKKKAEEEEAKKAEAEAKRLAEEKAKAEAEAKAKAEEAKRLEEERKKAEADAKKLADAKAKAEAEAKAKAATEAKAKAEAEAKRKAEEAKHLEEERKKAEAEAKRLAEEKAKADAEAKRKAEEAKKLAEEKAKADAEAKRLEEERKRKEAEAAEKNKPVNLLDKNGVEWRILTVKDTNADSVFHPSKLTHVNHGRLMQNLLHQTKFANTYVKSPLAGVSDVDWVNLNEESTKTGNAFLGIHKGSIKKEFPGEVVTSVEIDKSLERPNILTKDKVTQIDYIYINQPYSSYGFLFTPEDNQSRSFTVSQSAWAANSSVLGKEYHVVVKDEKLSGAPTGRIIWNDGIAGDATYKGELIATYLTRIGDTQSEVVAPHIDGTVTINAHFGNTWDKTKMSGEINSNRLGKMTFSEQPIVNTYDGIGNDYFSTDNKISIDGKTDTPTISVHFVGPELNEAVGTVWAGASEYSPSIEKQHQAVYDAVFGATKQPK